MTLKRLSILLILSTTGYGQHSLSLLPFEGTEVSSALRQAGYNKLETALIESGRFQVIEKEKRDQVLQEQKDQWSGCFEDSCIVELGKLLGANYLIYVESLCKNGTTFCGGCYGDFSDAPFRLYLNELVLINPNGGEVWTRGETETITWTNDSTTQNVHLELWKGGSELQDIYYLLENEFFYEWAPLYELTSGNDYQIKVVSWETNKSDMSDETFTID